MDEEQRHKDVNEANEMLQDGKTLGEINTKLHIWYELPEHLENVNKDNCFAIPHWQGCNKPANQIRTINFDGKAYVSGCGGWMGYYGEYLYVSSNYLKDPRPSCELFIDKRYGH